ncbi:aspartic peptidase domain-containing protein [Abortiporus biennis]|nr:aspartic peptidase domain-containing protein [Abortiporus biennis]
MPVQRRDNPHSTVFNFNNSVDPFNFGVVNSQGDQAIIYVGTVYIDDQPFEVQLDTGSADLWIDGTGITFKNAQNTHIQGGITYGDGTSAQGDIYVATVKFGDFTIEKQAFINALGTNATTANDKGLLGIGPPLQSGILSSLQNSTHNGQPLLNNIFNIYPNESNFLTMQLTRSDLGMVDGGVFTIGEIDSNFSAIMNSPKLEVITTLDMWHTLMEGIIINGKSYTGHGNSTNVPAGVDPSSLVILLDSGTSLTDMPAYYVDLIYKNIPGAKPIADMPGMYQLPCDTKLNVSMVFAGKEYPIHPLDLTAVTSSEDGKSTICINTLSYADTSDTRQDMILGDSFMRNVYSLFDFGNFTTSSDGNPFMQLLSLTNKDQAWSEFDSLNEKRIKQWSAHMLDSTNKDTETNAVAGNAASTDASTSTADSPDLHTLLRNSYIIIGLLAATIVLLFVVAVLLFRNQRKAVSTSKGYSSVINPVGPSDHKKHFSYETPYDS